MFYVVLVSLINLVLLKLEILMVLANTVFGKLGDPGESGDFSDTGDSSDPGDSGEFGDSDFFGECGDSGDSSVCTSSLQHFHSGAFKSSQNHIRPKILFTIEKRMTSQMTMTVTRSCIFTAEKI